MRDIWHKPLTWVGIIGILMSLVILFVKHGIPTGCVCLLINVVCFIVNVCDDK